jgi:N-acetyl-anhydromuramyl-L-alanine amidase AmpD
MEIKLVPGCSNRWIISGNQGVAKPKAIKPIIAAVLHHTGSFNDQSTIEWFTKDKSNKGSSAHFLVGLWGDIYQFVDEGERSWHAGVSSMTVNGITYSNWNMFSIGIELTGNGTVKPYTEKQYSSLVPLLSMLVNRFNIKKEFLVGHEQIAPGRKVDPGKFFDWERVYREVYDVATPGYNSPGNIIYSTGV